MANEHSIQPVGRRDFLKGIGAAAATAAGPRAFAASGLVPRAPSDQVVRIGVVGGNFGAEFQWHLDPNCKVTAVCDLREDRLDRLVQHYGPAARYKDFRTFLKHPELDAVAIFTPAPLHVWMATEAMKVGKHAISAVPAGMSEEELELLLETVRKTGMKYMMAETSYYRPQVITCREWARQGKFGTIFYTEAEYHHEGLIAIMTDERGFPTWRHGFPPMHYPTHSVGIVVPITGERLVEVEAMGWGDNHPILATNEYGNPFWNTTGFFKTSGGHSSRISVFWHVATGGTERGAIYGDRMSYIMGRPEGSPDTVVQIGQEGKTALDANGYPEGKVKSEAYHEPTHWEVLPAAMRVPTGHGGSHTFLTHEFISAIVEDRWPRVNVYEAIAYTLPGIVAHQSALRGGEHLKIKDHGAAPA
jgi:predicted dehydrogenase